MGGFIMMHCFDLDSLIRHVHGEHTAQEAGAIRLHLAACARCRDEAVSLEALEKGLRAVVLAQDEATHAGSSCLGTDLFAAYLEGSLTDAERESAEKHLAGCRECREELTDASDRLSMVAQSLRPTPARLLARAMDLGKVLGGESPQIDEEEGLLEIVVRWVNDSLELVRTSGQWTFATASQPVRRGDTPAQTGTLQVEKKIGKFSVTVEVRHMERGLFRVIVRVMENAKLADRIRVSLLSGKREQASFLARQGKVLFDRISVGSYHLIILEAGAPVGKIRLKVEDSRHE
jgi:hypothetical protein